MEDIIFVPETVAWAQVLKIPYKFLSLSKNAEIIARIKLLSP
jgi:hypothetical protein